MPYNLPAYETASISVSLDVANAMLPVLVGLAQGAGINNVPLDDPPKPNVQEWQLGFAVRMGLPSLDPGAIGAAIVDRFDARIGVAVTSSNALLFAADVALATALAASTGRTLAQVYRTAAHVYLSRYTQDSARFFVPSF